MPERGNMAQEYYDPWSNTKTKHGLDADLVISALQKCIRRGDEATAMRMAYELYVTSTFHEEKMWNRLLVIPIEDIGFGDPMAAVIVKNLNDLRKKSSLMVTATVLFSSCMRSATYASAKKSVPQTILRTSS